MTPLTVIAERIHLAHEQVPGSCAKCEAQARQVLTALSIAGFVVVTQRDSGDAA